jgi:peptide/nickel transport system substrate-binding protein
VAALILLGACTSSNGGGGNGGGGSNASTVSACSGSPRSGGSLVFARAYETTTINPLELGDSGSIFSEELIYNTLVRPDPNGTPHVVPGLADTWKVSSDRLDYSFHIRNNAKWSTGTPVTAQDVKFSLDRWADPKINTSFSFLADGYKGTEVVDPHNLVIHMSKPVAAILDYISIYPAMIVPEQLVKSQGDAFWNKPVGSGPFMVQEFVRGDHLTLVKNPYYWEPGKPYLDQVRLDFVTDDNTRMLDLQSGQAQVAENVPYLQSASIDAAPDVHVQANEIPRFEPVFFNVKSGPLADPTVREALSLASDREAINKAVFGGVGTIPNSWLTAGLEFTAPNSVVPPYQYDLPKAKSLMASSSVPNGFDLTLLYPAGDAVDKQLATLLQSQWGQIGVRLKLEAVDQAALWNRYYAYDYQAAINTAVWTSDVPVPDELGAIFGPAYDGFFTGWKNPSWPLVQKALVAPESQRSALWVEIQKAMMNQPPPWVNLLWVPQLTGVADNVCDMKLNLLGAYRLEDAWLAS